MMRYILPLIVLTTLISFAFADEAHWHGFVYYNQQVVDGATVYTTPTGGQTTTNYAGFYNLCNENGMEDGITYYWVNAYKTIGTLKTGKYYSNDVYYEDTAKGPMNITLSDPNK
jgi:hypothetical protein